MVKYESSAHVLSLTRKVILSDGCTPVELSGKLDLTDLSEPERQRIIAVAKLITNWCSGHDIDEIATQKQGESEVKLLSPLSKVNAMLVKPTIVVPVSEGESTEKVE
jgi:hypothetical protein